MDLYIVDIGEISVTDMARLLVIDFVYYFKVTFSENFNQIKMLQ